MLYLSIIVKFFCTLEYDIWFFYTFELVTKYRGNCNFTAFRWQKKNDNKSVATFLGQVKLYKIPKKFVTFQRVYSRLQDIYQQ